MKTYLECIPCFFKQALLVSQETGCCVEKQKIIMDKVSELIPKFSLENTPPEMSGEIQRVIKNISGITDPYDDIKRVSRARVRKVIPAVTQLIENSDDPLLAAVKFAIAANIIDYGANGNLDQDSELIQLLRTEVSGFEIDHGDFFNYEAFKIKLQSSKEILYIGDNVGEHFFDKLLMKAMTEVNPSIHITYATRDIPVLNDITVSDAIDAKIDDYADIISSGSHLPGTVIKLCNDDFISRYNSADMIISKGQGNFETLSDESGPLFLLLMVKCPAIAKHTNCKLKDLLLLDNNFLR